MTPSDDTVVSLAWFPSGDYEEAIERWPSLAEDWSDVPHGDYSARLDGNIKRMRSQGLPIRAVQAIAWPGRNEPCWCGSDRVGADGASCAPHCISDRRSRVVAHHVTF